MAKERAHLTAGDGIGEPLITDFLKSIPGINSYTVRQQLAILRHLAKQVMSGSPEIRRTSLADPRAIARHPATASSAVTASAAA